MSQLEKNFIIKICEDLLELNGTTFEYFAKDILSLELKDTVGHKGHNLYSKPVGYTADFDANNYEIIGQCGTNDSYFDAAKPIDDIDSAIKNHPQSKIIYLFANQRGTGGKLSTLNQLITSKSYTQQIEVFDSERIANTILKNIIHSLIGTLLEEYLPSSFEIYRLMPETNKVPTFTSKKYFQRNNEDIFIKQLIEKKIIQIFGISGLGKSEFSKSIVDKLITEYETAIWIDGDDIKNASFSFESVHISKFNQNINLKTLLENHKIILIFDNFNDNLNELKSNFELLNKCNSTCIITSLQENLSKSNTYKLDYLDSESSKNILKESQYDLSDALAEEIISYIDGYPLLLNILRDSVDNGDDTWEDVFEDLRTSIQRDDPEKNKKVSTRILEKYMGNIKDELKWINLLKSRFLSKEFFKFVVTREGVKKLQKRSLIYDSENSFYTVHQIILDAISDLLEFNIEESYPLLLNFLNDENDKKSVGYYNFIFRHDDFLDNICKNLPYENELNKQIFYAKIQGRNENNDDFLLEQFNNYTFDNDNKIDILLTVEKTEIELYNAKIKYKDTNEDKYLEICKEKIVLFEGLLAECNLDDIEIHINHHLGKIYSRIKNYEYAVELFDKVLAEAPDADYAKLQKARIYYWDNPKQHESEFEEIFESILNVPNKWTKQSLSVLLAIYELLSKNEMSGFRSRYIDDKIDDFINNLFYALSFSFEQPYQLLASLSYHFSYNQKEVFAEICEKIPLPSTIGTDDKLKYAFATIQVAYYKNLKYSLDAKKEEKMRNAFYIAETYFKSMDLSDYRKGKFVDLYIEANEFKEALNVITTYTKKDDAFYLQKLSKIYRGLADYKKALDAIDAAISIIGENKRYLSAFLNDKAEIFYADGKISDAISNLEKAITKQENFKTTKSWESKLDRWKE